jgi:hypothetical protein
LDNGSFSSPLLLSFKLQYPGPNRPTNVAAPNECEQYCEGRVYHGHTRSSARILRIGITRRNPASFNKAGPSRQISACCEEDHGLSIDKRAPTLKSLMRQFLTRKTVCKPTVRNVEVNKFQKRCPMRKPVQDRIPASTGAPDRIARGCETGRDFCSRAGVRLPTKISDFFDTCFVWSKCLQARQS